QGETWRQRFKWGMAPKRMTEMLLALPMLAFCSGLLAAASTVVVLPAARKEPMLLIVVAALAYVTLASGKLLSDATRYLYFHAREQADAAERARAQAADAQLAALQAQVNPHFLFNALNTIAALVRTDPRSAEATTENLARVLRRTLDRTRRTDCTVEDEVDFLRAWLAVERERFGDRLRVDFEVEPAAEPLRIPTMTLQPLVENSLKHGIAGKLEGGRVTVRVQRQGDRLRLEVEDDGAGFPREPREGTGLANLRHRLETIYGADAELRVERPPAGAWVVVELPAVREPRPRAVGTPAATA
ncbi:MAG: histidine kinase, partial [Gemmatimonadetes bacterium]|nr:histidine kinase [Gemmatimonadota bacterium]